MGDFNIPGHSSKAFKALEEFGLTIPAKLRRFKTNLKKTKHYDQIGYYKENTDCEIANAGIIDFYDAFFHDGMSPTEYEQMTFQISDHLPLWMELSINETSLDQFIRNRTSDTPTVAAFAAGAG